MKQFSLFPGQERKFHGGEVALGKRKSRRPLARRKPIHLTLKAARILSSDRPWLSREVQRLLRRFGIRLYSLAIAPDHLHLVITIPGRREFAAFVRSFAGIAARRLGKGLWQLLPFTRVASWGRDFRNLLAYLQKNREETNIERAYIPRQDRYRRFRARGRSGALP